MLAAPFAGRLALHWTEATMQEQAAMGFHEGWGAAAQLEALAQSL